MILWMALIPLWTAAPFMENMATDVRDVGDHYELDMDLPGFKKDEIHAELENAI